MFDIQDSTCIYGIPPIQGPICDENSNKLLSDCTNNIVVMMMHGNIVIDLLKFHLYLYKLMHHPRSKSPFACAKNYSSLRKYKCNATTSYK